MTNLPPIFYGVWNKGRGWLKATNSKTGKSEALRFINITTAYRVAQRVHGRVEPIDDSLIDLEDELIRIEKESGILFRLNVLFNKARKKDGLLR